MAITAEIVADSLSTQGIRLTTFLLRYPRFIHAELMTHRVFSRNASSSRAIPVKKMIADIRKEPATFAFWGRNEKGMQASSELEGFALWAVQTLWIWGMWIMTTLALLADKLGAHKQTVNRMVEPWSHITVVVTSTDYGNWFALRDHKDAMPEIMWLARYMQEAYLHSQPKHLLPGEWHLPFVDHAAKTQIWAHLQDLWKETTGDEFPEHLQVETNDHYIDLARQVSVSRCARTSYKTHDSRTATVKEELGLYARLIDRTPLHASPTEHQATPDRQEKIQVFRLDDDGALLPMTESTIETRWWYPNQHGNFTGWRQFRKMLPGENQADPAHHYDWLVQRWRESEFNADRFLNQVNNFLEEHPDGSV
jgi:hypothetical protein